MAQEFGEQLELAGVGGTGHGSSWQADFKHLGGLGFADLSILSNLELTQHHVARMGRVMIPMFRIS